MSQYRISLSASQDLNQISEYFLARNLTAGERFFQEFNRKCKYLTQFPYLGKSYDYLLADLRGLPLDGYFWHSCRMSKNGKPVLLPRQTINLGINR
ncbi:type II toxin-antitoxin system RelE/ParE family toxin [Planktothrix sp. FACHB-1365]|uniref:type II toxin-antitoxin system RelE/ParE family toxin n=1 Tax=Planktothrix sp. FACHB-1365 TaxID=2692855 RepID=UPI001689E081|nr:type II toxin-antitoxin system RelE/ParE family toxin [Planktothrix sp. FACHB-1365]MBD2483538.1 type II toxin-antitoxin system RelE/ParE family toxin [Planktothrix sp. FACHB-1365]